MTPYTFTAIFKPGFRPTPEMFDCLRFQFVGDFGPTGIAITYGRDAWQYIVPGISQFSAITAASLVFLRGDCTSIQIQITDTETGL